MPSILNATTTNGLVTSADNSGSLQLQTNNGTTAVTIDTSQNVGIGTSTGGAKLQVSVGTTNISGSAWNNSNFVVGGSSSTSGGFGVSYNDTTGAIIASLLPATAWKDLTTYSNQTIFCTSGVNERMRITSDGDVLVGKTSLSDSTNGIQLRAGGGTFIIGGTSSGTEALMLNRNTSDGTIAAFKRANTTVGTISVTGSATAYNTSSDYRLKENIAPMQNALSVVQQLKPVTYNWKVDGSAGQGFIAHELQAVVPDCVTGEKDAVELVDVKDEEGNVIGQEEKPIYQGVDTSFLVATLTAAIQELKAELDSSNLILTSVKTELDTVKAELNTLKNPPVEGTE